MSLLRVFPEERPDVSRIYTKHTDISSILGELGILFERWVAGRELALHATQDEVLASYDVPVTKLMKERGFVTVDVVSVNTQMPNHPELRKKFLEEHTHAEDEARFFVEGSGIFYIHRKNNVYAVLCQKGDFIDLPPKTEHWFDMGTKPNLKVIRTFCTPEGWVAEFTGSDIAGRFPRYDEIVTAVPV